jgi:tRNA-dihydrouridine synthase B
MKLDRLEVSSRVFLAPLCGITDTAFRLVAKDHGAGLVYTEMISAEGLVRGGAKTHRLLEFRDDERPIGVQLFGSQPEALAGAVQIVTEKRPDLIDLNFGCPSRKVVRKNGGAALLKDLTLMEGMVRAAVGATDLPVTVKIRSGWDETAIVAGEAAVLCEALGVAGITIHPRTRQQGFSGRANWELIGLVKESVEIPVIGNGDVRTPQAGLRMFQETGCDAIMIGRGALGNPWIFNHIVALLKGKNDLSRPSVNQRIDLCLRHTRESLATKGDFTGLRQMRKHFGWYTKGFPGGGQLRRVLVRQERLKDVESVFQDYQKERASSSQEFPQVPERII